MLRLGALVVGICAAHWFATERYFESSKETDEFRWPGLRAKWPSILFVTVIQVLVAAMTFGALRWGGTFVLVRFGLEYSGNAQTWLALAEVVSCLLWGFFSAALAEGVLPGLGKPRVAQTKADRRALRYLRKLFLQQFKAGVRAVRRSDAHAYMAAGSETELAARGERLVVLWERYKGAVVDQDIRAPEALAWETSEPFWTYYPLLDYLGRARLAEELDV